MRRVSLLLFVSFTACNESGSGNEASHDGDASAEPESTLTSTSDEPTTPNESTSDESTSDDPTFPDESTSGETTTPDEPTTSDEPTSDDPTSPDEGTPDEPTADEPTSDEQTSPNEPTTTNEPPTPTLTASCDPLPPADGDVVELGPGDDLAAAIAAATTGTTLLLADGTYDVSAADYLVFSTPGVTLRSRSGNPEAVVLDGGYEIGSILNVRADDVTIAEVTLQHCQWHPIHVTGGVDSDITGTLIYRVSVIDPGQQGIKINSSDGHYADDGTIACSTILLTDAGREHVTDCYTGGIDAHLARGWWVHHNRIEGFFCQEGLSEHAVHFWNSARDTVVEQNQIVDCARGVGFGLGESGNGTARDYGDDACPGADFVGHYGGVIRNNIVFGGSSALFASEFGFDSGVSLEQACGTEVVHNTVFATEEPFVSMEYRFGNTDVVIANNLTSHRIMERDGATAQLLGNITDAQAGLFVDAAAGDLHSSAGSAAIDAAEPLPSGPLDVDFDGEPRDASPDVGADEL